MISLTALWLPILLSAVIVFIASSVIHMVFTYHQTDFGKVPAEDDVMDALRKFNIPPGNYVMPYAGSTKAMGSPEFIEKVSKGPVAFITMMQSGRPSMTGSLIQWFLYSIVVAIFTAYITAHAVPPGGSYLSVFRIAGCAAFMGYAMALWQNSIWYKLNWSVTLKSTLDGLIYGLLTAGTFGWLWPA